MARSLTQIRDAMKATLRSLDPTLDLEVGPLYDYLISPVPLELVSIENQVERLKRFYSTNFADVATPEEARDFANNFGTGPDPGGVARATVVFYRTSIPGTGQDSTVPVGALVATADNSLVFRAIQTATLYGAFASSNFNAATNRYELPVVVEAVAPGQRYNVPVGRITKMMTPISGFEGVVQTSAANGGTEPEDALTLAQRVQLKFKGLDRNSINGLASLGKQAYSTLIRDIRVVRPTDRTEFRRLTSGPSLDVYVDGVLPQQFTEDYLAVSAETVVPLGENRTATSILSVSVNGQVLDAEAWQFSPDLSAEYQYSTRANPSIQLSEALQPNDLVEITGTRNDLLDRLQLLYSSEDSVFQTDILVRSFIDLPIIVGLEVRINSGDSDTIKQYIQNYLTDYIDPQISAIPSLLVPDTIREQLRVLVPEIENVKIYEFRRKIGSVDSVEVIVPLKNQVPRFDSVASTITVRF